MKYAAYLFDGTYRTFDVSAKAIVEKAILEKLPVRLEGELVQGSAISRIEKLRDSAIGGSELRLVAEEVFTRPNGNKFFWERIIEINRVREIAGKPWAFARAIQFAKRESGFTSPDEVMAFLEAEWETVKEYNVPSPKNPDSEARRQIHEYLVTDAGKNYLQFMRRFSFS